MMAHVVRDYYPVLLQLDDDVETGSLWTSRATEQARCLFYQSAVQIYLFKLNYKIN